MKKPNKARAKVVVSEERIRGKLAECEFFLEQMNENADPQVFGYHLSAFLSALSTLTILGLMRNHGQNTKRALEQLRKSASELDFLLNSRDVEVHREGVGIWLLRSNRVSPRFRGGIWGDLWVTPRYGSRYAPRFRSKFGDGMRVALERTSPATGARGTFIFHKSGEDVLTCSRAALDAVRPLAL